MDEACEVVGGGRGLKPLTSPDAKLRSMGTRENSVGPGQYSPDRGYDAITRKAMVRVCGIVLRAGVGGIVISEAFVYHEQASVQFDRQAPRTGVKSTSDIVPVRTVYELR